MGVISTLLSNLSSNSSTAASSAGGISSGLDMLSSNFNGYGATMTSLNSFASQAEPFFVPTGALMPFAASTAPSGWYLCDGRSWATLGWSAGNALYDLLNPLGWSGLPDLQGKTIIGVQSGTYDLKTAYGTLNQTLAATNLPPHTHNLSNHTHSIDHDHGSVNTSTDGSHSHTYSKAVAAGKAGSTANDTLGSLNLANTSDSGSHYHSVDLPNYTGSSGMPSNNTSGTGEGLNTTPFSILQPSLALNYIIKG